MEIETGKPRPEGESTVETIVTNDNIHSSDDTGRDRDESAHDIPDKSFNTLDKDSETQVTDLDEEEEVENLQGSKSSPDEAITPQKMPFIFDPTKLNIRFLFANHDGLDVSVVCNPSDTVGQLKGQLLSLWPNGMFLWNKIKILRISVVWESSLFVFYIQKSQKDQI